MMAHGRNAPTAESSSGSDASQADLEARKKEFSEQLTNVLRENAMLRQLYVNHHNQLAAYLHENRILRQKYDRIRKELNKYRKDNPHTGDDDSECTSQAETKEEDDYQPPPPATPFSVEVLLSGQPSDDGSALRVPCGGITMMPRVDLTPTQYPPASTTDYYLVSHNQSGPPDGLLTHMTTQLPEEPLMESIYGLEDLQRYFADQRSSSSASAGTNSQNDEDE